MNLLRFSIFICLLLLIYYCFIIIDVKAHIKNYYYYYVFIFTKSFQNLPVPHHVLVKLAFTFLGSFSTEFRDVAVEISAHLATKALERLTKMPCALLAFQFISKVFSGVEVRTLCKLREYGHTDLVKP